MAVRRPYNPGKPDIFGKTPTQYRVEFANRVLKSQKGLSSAEQMAELQKASRGNPAPRGGVTGRLEGNIAQGTGGNSYSPFKTPPMGGSKIKPVGGSGGSRARVDGVGRGGGIRIGTRRGIGER